MSTNRISIRYAVATVILILGTRPGLAAGSISSGKVTFAIGAFGATPSADLTGVSSNLATDHLFHSGWWYRVSGDLPETPFPDPDAEDYTLSSGRKAQLDWTPLDPGGKLAAHESIIVTSDPDGIGGTVYREVQLSNLSVLPVTVDLFHYVDMDVDGTATESGAELKEWTSDHVLEVDDDSGEFGLFVAYRVSDWVPAKFCVATYQDKLRDELNDSNTDDCENTGLPFPSGDFTAIHQFTMTLSPGQVGIARVAIAINAEWNCGAASGIFCDGFDWGDSSLWSASVP